MSQRLILGSLAASLLAFSGSVGMAFTPPVVSNVTASQRTDGSHIVDVYYDLSGATATIEVDTSDDAGATWVVPITSVTGDVDSYVPLGTGKHIIWNSFTDLPGITANQFKVRVCANDVATPASGMVLIPAGEFVMGDHHDGGGFGSLPLHTVYTDAIYMDKFEVTNQQYADALNWAYKQGLITVSGGVVRRFGGTNLPYCLTTSGSSYSRIIWDGGTFGVTAGKENHPMVMMTWYGSAAYANWRSGIEGRTPCYDTSTWACNFAANGYRLPTEAEWEKAARGGNTNPYYRYPWGDSINDSQANYLYSGDLYETESQPSTTPVGYYDGGQTPAGVDMANGYGLYDMSGNVHEWCNDWWDGSYYSVSPYSNPKGPASGAYHVVRGGAWNWFDFLSCAFRHYDGSPSDMFNSFGFRLALNSDCGGMGSAGSSCGDSAEFAIDNTIPFGDINGSGSVNLDDILCILSSFAGNYTCAGGLANADIGPCGGDGAITLDDILKILAAFAGIDSCP